MAKAFQELFSNLKLSAGLTGLLENAQIERVTTNRQHDVMRIYLSFQDLIPKRRIWKLEKAIASQYFKEQQVDVRIIERFYLSEAYNAKNLFASYRDSIYEEIEHYSSILYGIIKKADFTFDRDDHLELTLEDTVLARGREEEIHNILDKIFCQRCGQTLLIDIAYKQAKRSRYRADTDAVIANRVTEIVERQKQMREKEAAAEAAQGLPSEDLGLGHRPHLQKQTGGEKGQSPDFAKRQGEPGKRQEGGRTSVYYAAGGSSADRGKPSWKQGERGSASFRGPRPLKYSSRADLIYGRDFDDEVTPISEIQGAVGEVCIRGQIISCETREIRNERTLVSFALTDFTDSIVTKLFVANAHMEELEKGLHKGAFVKIKGTPSLDTFDHDLTMGYVKGIMAIPSFQTIRADNAATKRVELHCHTKMSDMDGVSAVEDIVRQARHFGHKALAITDHGVVQAFPDADHEIGKDPDFKVIYGMEAYLVDDTKTVVTDGLPGQSLDDSFVVFDIETTGFSAEKDRIIEIGAVRMEGGRITDRFSSFVNPGRPIPFRITELTSIRDDMVIGSAGIEEVLPDFLAFSQGAIMVAHNADFDMGFIRQNCLRLHLEAPATYMDTVAMGRYLMPSLHNQKLNTLAKALKIDPGHHHRAVDDAEATAHIFEKFIQMFRDRGMNELSDINANARMSDEVIRKMHANHCILIARNDIGRINLYKLTSLSHLRFFQRQAKIPKSLVEKYREGLIIGSACEAGELFQALEGGRPPQEISRIVSFYDYLEIQPIGNNRFLLEADNDNIQTEEDLRDFNRRIVRLGEDFHKPVCATGDVHFLNPEDEIYRRIIQVGKGFKDADHQPPLFLHTTEEMLEEFSYLGMDKAREVVITNTNRIADMCERIHPTRPDKCPPVIANSDQMLRTICHNRAHELYGKKLPAIVEERMERELNSIIGNGYAVMYIIAQKLVWKSNEDGYLVGSRGSVGSSFAAYLAGITEVNSLQAHYLCPDCKFVDFDSDQVKAFAGRSGCDMPDRKCPRCGADLMKLGFDIPFETFLGFKGNKEPDIDLNFSGEYQAKAHKYTEVIFGEGQTFKAGTIGTLADKTAYGYIKNYYEERGIHKRSCEIDRIVQGCVGIRRTTGQHPGGIVVLPVGEEINSFTPVQHPADDMTSDIITTHFDYHKIDGNLLKLDILGHDDPTMIRKLEDLTGLRATDIPLDDKAVMGLFMGTDSLGIPEGDQLWGGTSMGTLGIPEFGTDFAMGMLRDAKPKEFSDLIRISGLSHGTDVWLGNAKDLIQQGIASISTAICCRDDIMVYLINQGMDSEESFTIMERVRKGLVAKGKVADDWAKWTADMKEHGVPDWYIDSCEKIKYMFPKAHAAAYVMMAWRVAYCKVYYPLAYYAAFFSIRATAFSYEIMCRGRNYLETILAEYDKRRDQLSNKEQDTYRDMRIVQEMYVRGYEFLPLDLYQSDARYFKIVDGKLLPPFASIDGMGDKAAETLAIAAAQGKFLSMDDLKERGKLSQTIVDKLNELGLTGDMPKSNQLSIFDFA